MLFKYIIQNWFMIFFLICIKFWEFLFFEHIMWRNYCNRDKKSTMKSWYIRLWCTESVFAIFAMYLLCMYVQICSVSCCLPPFLAFFTMYIHMLWVNIYFNPLNYAKFLHMKMMKCLGAPKYARFPSQRKMFF